MAIVRVSGNLNIYGNQGNFETDPSTWGFSIGSGSLVRDSSQKTKDLYSAKYTTATSEFVLGILVTSIAKAPSIVIGKKYQIVAKVRTSSSNPIASDECYFSFEGPIVPFIPIEVNRTVAEAKDTWVQVEGYFEGSFIASGSTEFSLNLFQNTTGALNIGGTVWVDELEIYEYIDTEDPDPEPEPDPVSQKTYWSRNHIPFTVNQNDAFASLPNYRIRNTVSIEQEAGSSVYNPVYTSELEPNADEQCIFYLRPAFRGLLYAIAPTLNESVIKRLTDRIKYFKNISGDLYEELLVPLVTVTSDIFTVVMGGMSKRKFVEIGDYFLDYLPERKRFMTWAPIVKDVDQLQEDYLNFFIYSEDITIIKQVTKAYFDDDTNETRVSSPVAVGYNRIYQLPAGPANLSVATINPAKNVLRYEVHLIDQDDAVISETRTYNIVLVKHPLTRYILMLNSLGSYEVLRFTGKKEEQSNFDRTIVQRFLPHDYQVGDGEFENTDNNYRDVYSYSTGFFRDAYAEDWLEYMKEVFNSRRVFDITTGARIPIIINTPNLPGKKDQDYVRFARFEAIEAYFNESFTPEDI